MQHDFPNTGYASIRETPYHFLHSMLWETEET